MACLGIIWCQCHIQWTLAFPRSRQLKQVQDNLSCHVILASTSCDANGIINCTTAFIRSRKLRLTFLVIWCHLLCHCIMPLALTYKSGDVNDIIYGTFTFPRYRQWKWGATWLSWSCDNTGADICVTGCHQWHHQWYHYIPLIKVIKIRLNQPFDYVLPLALALASHDATGLRSSDSIGVSITWCKWHHQWHQHQVMPMSLSMISLHSLHQHGWSEAQHDFFVTLKHWYQCQPLCHMGPMPPLHSLGHDNYHDKQYDILVCDAIGIDISIMLCCYEIDTHPDNWPEKRKWLYNECKDGKSSNTYATVVLMLQITKYKKFKVLKNNSNSVSPTEREQVLSRDIAAQVSK